MNIKRIKEIAIKYKLTGDIDKFVKWFNTLFPDEHNSIEHYCAEWISRFNTEQPTSYMDLKSQRIYNEIYN